MMPAQSAFRSKYDIMWLCCESKEEGKESNKNMATLSVWTLTLGDHIVSFVLSPKPPFFQQFPLLISWIVCVCPIEFN